MRRSALKKGVYIFIDDCLRRGADHLIKLWDIGQRSCVSTSSSNADVWGFAWQPEGAGALPPGKQFAVAGDEKIVTLYRAAGAV